MHAIFLFTELQILGLAYTILLQMPNDWLCRKSTKGFFNRLYAYLKLICYSFMSR